MSAIKAKNTKPELAVRRALHALGFRYRLHRKELPGSPDIVLARRKAVVFVNGCFWHGHQCHLFQVPEARREFWVGKIEANVVRDRQALEALLAGGWRTATVWECALKGRHRRDLAEFSAQLCAWLESDETRIELTCIAGLADASPAQVHS